MLRRFLDLSRPGAEAGPVTREDIYPSLGFPAGVDGARGRRPFTAINMVATVDGKVVVGGPGTTHLIGGPTDHYLMTRIEGQADAVLFGAGLVRDDDPGYPAWAVEQRSWRAGEGLRPDLLWAAVSTRGDFPRRPRMFHGNRERSALFVSALAGAERLARLREWTQVFVCGETEVEPWEMGRVLVEQLGVSRMVSLGGPRLNGTLLEASAADELFLTLAPKIQGGSGWGTAVEGVNGGPGFGAAELAALSLISVYGDGAELYLRYRFPASEGAGV